MAAGFWFGEPWLDRRLFRSIARADADRELGPARAEVAPEGLRVTRGDTRGEIAWHTLVAVEVGPSAIYLFLTPEQARIIPRRAFADDAALREFVAAIEARRRRD